MSLLLGGRLGRQHAEAAECAGGWDRSPTARGAGNMGIFQLGWSIRHWWLSADLQPLRNSNGQALHLAGCEGCCVLATNFTIDQKSSLSIKPEISSNGKQFWKGQGWVFICPTSAFKQKHGPLYPLTVVRKFKIFFSPLFHVFLVSLWAFSLSLKEYGCVATSPVAMATRCVSSCRNQH